MPPAYNCPAQRSHVAFLVCLVGEKVEYGSIVPDGIALTEFVSNDVADDPLHAVAFRPEPVPGEG